MDAGGEIDGAAAAAAAGSRLGHPVRSGPVLVTPVLASYPAKSEAMRGTRRLGLPPRYQATSGLPVNLATLVNRSIIDVTSNTGVLTCSHSIAWAIPHGTGVGPPPGHRSLCGRAVTGAADKGRDSADWTKLPPCRTRTFINSKHMSPHCADSPRRPAQAYEPILETALTFASEGEPRQDPVSLSVWTGRWNHDVPPSRPIGPWDLEQLQIPSKACSVGSTG